MATIPNAFAGGGNASLTVPVNLRGTGTTAVFGAGSTGDTFNRIELGADGFIRLGSGSAPTDLAIGRLSSTVLNLLGFAEVGNLGQGFATKEGSNAKQGTAVLAAGTNTVANTSTTATSRIFVTGQVVGGTAGGLNVSARTAGTSFTITSTNAADTSTAAYEMFEVGA